MQDHIEDIMEDIVRIDEEILNKLMHERAELKVLLTTRFDPENMTETELLGITNLIDNTMEGIIQIDDEISKLMQERTELKQSFISGFYPNELSETELPEIDEPAAEPANRDLPPSIDVRRSKWMFEVGPREQEMFDPKGISGTEYLRRKYRRPKK